MNKKTKKRRNARIKAKVVEIMTVVETICGAVECREWAEGNLRKQFLGVLPTYEEYKQTGDMNNIVVALLIRAVRSRHNADGGYDDFWDLEHAEKILRRTIYRSVYGKQI